MDSAPRWRKPTKAQTRNVDSDSEVEDKSFEFDFPGASTPLKMRAETSTMFLSPIKKLHNLHLGASSPKQLSPMDPIEEKNRGNEADIDESYNNYDEDEDDDDDEYYSEAEQTILSDGSVEFKEESESTNLVSNPIYTNPKKRGMESPLDMIITPRSRSSRSIPRLLGLGASGNMSVCSASNLSQLKISFSNSDSTPCPRQPRKRLKFKEVTPSSTPLNVSKRKNILNLQSSTKASASILTQLNTIQRLPEDLEQDDLEEQEEFDLEEKGNRLVAGQLAGHTDYYEFESPMQSSTTANTSLNSDTKVHVPRQSTPISQSTPANSRAPTPPTDEPAEYGELINGYKFVRSQPRVSQAYYSYKTPENNPNVYSQEMRSAFIQGRAVESVLNRNPQHQGYEIVGEFPVTSAGLMDEEDEDLHIGDKRINDPYFGSGSKVKVDTTLFQADNETQKRCQIREQYFNSFDSPEVKLPLLELFEAGSSASKEEVLDLLDDGRSILEFYRYINEGSVLDLVKRERLKWHPDKWRHSQQNNNTKAHGNNQWVTDRDIIESLSRTLNLLVERLSQ